jgi:hypothetical protein
MVVDVSGMSKFLTAMLTQSWARLKNSVTIAYAEVEVYHPTKKEFEKKTKKFESPDLPIDR